MNKVEEEKINYKKNGCPYCGSKNVDFFIREDVAQFKPFGSEEKFNDEIFVCKECSTSFSLTNNFTDIWSELYEKSRQNSVKTTIEFLETKQTSLPMVEMFLNYPRGTFKRWKRKNKHNNSTINLLQMIGTFDWLIKLSKRNFENTEKIKKIQEFGNSLLSIKDENAFDLTTKRMIHPPVKVWTRETDDQAWEGRWLIAIVGLTKPQYVTINLIDNSMEPQFFHAINYGYNLYSQCITENPYPEEEE